MLPSIIAEQRAEADRRHRTLTVRQLALHDSGVWYIFTAEAV
jgi:hypothetical protein